MNSRDLDHWITGNYGEDQFANEEPDEEDESHCHTCQQCDALVVAKCHCEQPDGNIWCSSRCRAAFDL